MVRLKGQYELSDFVKAQRLHSDLGRLNDWLSYLGLGAAAAALAGILVALALGQPQALQALPGVLLVGGAGFIHAVWLPRRYARIFRQQKDLAAPFEIEINAQGVRHANEYGIGVWPWNHFVHWKENADLLLVYRSGVIMHMLPKRLFASEAEIDYARQLLRQHNVPVARDRRRLFWALFLGLIILVAVCSILYTYR